TPIRVVECTLPIPQTHLPVPHIPVPQQLIIPTPLQPYMSAKPTLVVVIPVARVLLIARQPVHRAISIPLVISPQPLIVVPTGIGHLPLAPFHASLPQSLIHRPIPVLQHPQTVS